jgi:AAA domain
VTKTGETDNDVVCVMPVPSNAGPPTAHLMKIGNHKADQQHEYRDGQGRLLGYVLRFEARGGGRKTFLPLTYWRYPNGRSRWQQKSWPPGRRPLFGLDKLAARPNATVLLVEGEKTAIALEFGPLAESFKWYGQDLVAVTWPGGGRAVAHADFTPLKSRKVIVLPDAHAAGEETADALVPILQGVGVSRLRRWQPPPEAQRLKDGWDIADEVPPGLTPERIVHSIADAPEVATPRIVLTLPEFLATLGVPHYVVDGLFKRGCFYSLTAMTGAGKTAVALLLSIIIADRKRRWKFGPHQTEHGRIVYVTRENPEHVEERLVGMAEKLGFDPKEFADTFLVIDKVTDLAQEMDRIRREIEEFGDVVLVVLDTSAALFVGDNENDPIQMLKHALTQRALCGLPGNPTVLALNHPIKAACSQEQLLPRGGGGYLNETDGNFTLWAHDDRLTDFYWTGKLRGPDFEKITFRLPTIRTPKLVDSNGRQMPTVMAEVVTTAQAEAVEKASLGQEDRLLQAMLSRLNGSLSEWAVDCGWFLPAKAGETAQPNNPAHHQATGGRKARDEVARPLPADAERQEGGRQGRARARDSPIRKADTSAER